MSNNAIPKLVNILSIINTDGITTQKDSDVISQNIFMLNDSNYSRQFGSTLQINCKPGDKLRFRFSGVKSDSSIQLVHFRKTSRRTGILAGILYDSAHDCWEAEVRSAGEGSYLWTLNINNKLYQLILSIDIVQPLYILGIIDCANVVEDYDNFGYYTYLLDSRNDSGTGESKIPDPIGPMAVKCSYGDILCFSLRGILPSDMPSIKQLKSDICRFVANPANYPDGTWIAYIVGNEDSSLEFTVTMPDGTDHTFIISLNMIDTN